MTKIFSVLSGKGGTGKTTFSINISLALKKLGNKVVLIDGNISMPHVFSYLGINSWSYSLNNFLSGKNFERESLINYNGIKVLVSSPNLGDLGNVDLKKFKKIIEDIKSFEEPDFIIIDGPPGIGKETISIIEASDEILLVIQPFEQNIIDALKIIEISKSLGKEKIKLILNNGFWLRKEKLEEIKKKVKIEVLGFIPFNKDIMFSSVNKIPIIEEKPNSLISEMITEIASKLCNEDYNESLKLKFFKVLRNFISSI